MKYNNHTQSGREEEMLKTRPLMDDSERNLKMVQFPEWKERQKNKWVDSKDYMCLGKSTYEMLIANTTKNHPEPYVEIEKNPLRQRNKFSEK